MFLHAGWTHLLGNMLFLWIFGDNLEARLGPAKYLAVYLGTGVATLFFRYVSTGLLHPVGGTSGAISGVLGCYFLWFPKNQVKVLFGLFFYPNHQVTGADCFEAFIWSSITYFLLFWAITAASPTVLTLAVSSPGLVVVLASAYV